MEAQPSFPFSRSETAPDEPPCEFAHLRSQEPIKVRLWDGSEPWLFVKHQDICQVLDGGDGTLWSKDRSRPNFPELSPSGKIAAKSPPTFVYQDEPQRLSDRALIDHLFSRENVDRLKPQIILKAINRRLDVLIQEARQQQPIDLVEKFALRVPTDIIYTLLGAPESDLDLLSQWNAAQIRASSTPTETNGIRELPNYIKNLFDERRAKPQNDLISHLILNQVIPGHIDKDHALRIVFPMLVTATITNLICWGTILLLRHPDQLHDLQSNPSLAKPFVEELCRLHTGSAISSFRVATQDTVIRGKRISAGDGILLCNQSGNRDEEVFPNPDTFDIHRPCAAKQAIAFGYGPRRCPVEWYAREQLETIFAMLFIKFPKLKLAVPESQIQWLPATGVLGVSELLVNL
ncbi:cytochrome P450 55A3 [Trichoderma velutinum]